MIFGESSISCLKILIGAPVTNVTLLLLLLVICPQSSYYADSEARLKWRFHAAKENFDDPLDHFRTCYLNV